MGQVEGRVVVRLWMGRLRGDVPLKNGEVAANVKGKRSQESMQKYLTLRQM